MEKISFRYFYGGESEQFSYYRIPRKLIVGAEFKQLSTDAKLLYGLMLDRMGLSIKNGWYDAQGRVYIYYSLNEIQEDINCGHEKAVKLLAELDAPKGIGLINRVKQGQGKPTIIYVMQFTAPEIPHTPECAEGDSFSDEQNSRLPKTGSQEVGIPEVKSAEKQKSRLPKIRSADFGKTECSYLKYNQPDSSYLDPSIYQSQGPPPDVIDRYEYRERVEENIGYEVLQEKYQQDDVDGIVELILDALCTTAPTIRVGGSPIQTQIVQERLWKLDQSHIEYVFSCLAQTATKIKNIRAYLLTALYNAPVTINRYYQAEVQHDFGP